MVLKPSVSQKETRFMIHDNAPLTLLPEDLPVQDRDHAAQLYGDALVTDLLGHRHPQALSVFSTLKVTSPFHSAWGK